MAGKRSAGAAGGRPRVDGRNLVLLETLLVVGLAQEVAEDGILDLTLLHPLVRVALAIALVVGAFGGMVLVFERFVHRGIVRTHEAVRRLPLPAPVLLAHGLVLGGIFLGYAWYWDARTGALAALGDLAARAAVAARALAGG